MHVLERHGVRALAMAVVLALPASATAEPVTITSGFVEANIFSSLARGQLVGDGLSLTFGADAFATSVLRLCGPCTPGSTVDLGAMFAGSRSAGAGVVDGVTYPLVFLDVTATFSTPSFQVNGSETVTLTRPFSFAGTLTGYLLDPWVHGSPDTVFTKSLTGQGTATATFTYVAVEGDAPTFTPTDLRYDFSAPAPVPEPATVLLCGAGIAALGLRRRRQRRRTTT